VLHVLEQRLNFLNFKTKLGHLSFHVAGNSIVEVWVFRSHLVIKGSYSYWLRTTISNVKLDKNRTSRI